MFSIEGQVNDLDYKIVKTKDNRYLPDGLVKLARRHDPKISLEALKKRDGYMKKAFIR